MSLWDLWKQSGNDSNRFRKISKRTWNVTSWNLTYSDFLNNILWHLRWKKFKNFFGFFFLSAFVSTSFSEKLSLILRYGGHEKKVRDLALSMGFTHVSLSSEIMAMEKIVPRGYTGKFIITRSKFSFSRLVHENIWGNY